MTGRTVLDMLREREKGNPPWMYACHRLGHFLHEDGLCHSCLKRFPRNADGSFDTSKPIDEATP